MLDRGLMTTDDPHIGAYEAVLDEFYGNIVKALPEGGQREITLDCSVSREQGRFLYDLVRSIRPKLCIETGMAWGGSAIHICSALKANGEGKLTSIDPLQFRVYSGVAHGELHRLGFGDLSETLELYSDVALPRLLSDGVKAQFAFVDGDHRFDGIFIDFHYLRQILDVGGTLVFDDAHSQPMQKLKSYIAANHANMRYEGEHHGRFAHFTKVDDGEQRSWESFDF